MLQALLEAGIKPDVIVGTSIGAVNAAHLAADPSLENMERLREVGGNGRAGAIFPPRPFHNAKALFRDGAFFSVHLWRKFLEDRAQYRNIEDAAVPLRITATDYEE